MFDIAPGSFEPAVKVIFSPVHEGDLGLMQTLWGSWIFVCFFFFFFLRPLNSFVCDLGEKIGDEI